LSIYRFELGHKGKEHNSTNKEFLGRRHPFGSIPKSVMSIFFFRMGSITGCSPSVLADLSFPKRQIGESKGVFPFGRRAKPEKGRQGAGGDRWKGEFFPLQGPLIPPWGTPSAAGVAVNTPCHPSISNKEKIIITE